MASTLFRIAWTTANMISRLSTEAWHGLEYLLVLNYETVSTILRGFIYVFSTIWNVLTAVSTAIYDLGDQYGDLCVAVVRMAINTAAIVGQCFVGVGHAMFNVIASVVEAIGTVARGPVVALRLLRSFVEMLQATPARLLDSTVDGFRMLGEAAIDTSRTGATMAKESIRSVVGAAKGSVAAVTKNRIDREFLDKEATVVDGTSRILRMEVLIGLVICIAAYWIVKERARIRRGARRKLIMLIRLVYIAWRRLQSTMLRWSGSIRAYFRPTPFIAQGQQPPINRDARFVRFLRRLPLNPRNNDDDDRSAPGANRSRPKASGAYTSTKSKFDNDGGASSTIDPDRYLCVVCQDAERSVMAQNCRHVCMCEECADAVYADQRRCPICRGFMTSLTNVYL